MKNKKRVWKAQVTQPFLAACAVMERSFQRLRVNQQGQGTTEYAILVGVLVVIAIIAVIAFKDNLQSLWESITEGINSL